MQDLDKFKNEMNLSGKNVYVGHRYVPKIMGDWDNTQIYEPLSIVQYQGNSFTSRQFVPSGVELTNEEYWVSTGNYNAQIEQYRQDVVNLTNDVNNFNDDIQEVNTQLEQTKVKTDWIVNVKEFGAKGDGVTDDTHAFNLATRGYEKHTGGNSSDFNRTIIVPDGNYLIEGTVYVHKGQHLKGSGQGSSRILIPVKSDGPTTFRLGHSLVDGVEVQDTGGLPPAITNLQTQGGSVSKPVFDGEGVAGISLNNLFITGASTAINMPSGDFQGYNLTIDDGSVGIRLGGSRNVITACSFFWNNFAIISNRDTYDVIISDSNFHFDKFASIQLNNHKIKNLQITNCNFSSNAQDPTFYSTIFLNGIENLDMTISDCHFSNQNGFAIKHQNNAKNNNILINDCVFDGDKTHDSYIQGSSSKGIAVGQNKIKINGSIFKNLRGETAIVVDHVNGVVELNNCEWENLNSDYLIDYQAVGTVNARFNKGDLVTPLIKGIFTGRIGLYNNIDWWGEQVTLDDEYIINIPMFNEGDFREFSLIANTNPKSATAYRKQGKFIVGIYTDYIDGGVKTVPFVETIYKSPNSSYAPAIEVSVDYNTENKTLLIKYPSSYANLRRLEVV